MLTSGCACDTEQAPWFTLRKAGLDKSAIPDSTLVVAYFNFVNCIVMALGVQLAEKVGEAINIETRK